MSRTTIGKVKEWCTQRLKRGLVRHWNNVQIVRMARQIARRAPVAEGAPMVFFKASTGIDDLSWNSGFHLLAAWALRLKGVPVIHVACRSGMSRCVLGTHRDHPQRAMPCRSCVYQSQVLLNGLKPFSLSPSQGGGVSSGVYWLSYRFDPRLAARLEGRSLDELMGFEHEGVPLGALCLPGLRWILRRHHLQDDEPTRFLLREYILSAWSVARHFADLLDQTQPRAVVLFNGQFFPEAVARWVALRRGIRVITHEVGLQPASAFFTEGEATAYPIHIPDTFELTPEQNARLDAYLSRRFQGDFTMAGIRFWPSMQGLDEAFLQKAARFKQIVPIFTNVIFDTSQPHANTVFGDMFEWLDRVLKVIRRHPETLFVIRAHPDELRVRKESRETVEDWATRHGVREEPNVMVIGPRQPLSSYELIQRSKFVMVYNSTIGLEASILGAPVLCAGRARYTRYPTVFFPQTPQALVEKMEEFLQAEQIVVPPEFQRNARRFLYYQLFRTSLPFDEFLAPSVRTTHARLKRFSVEALLESPSIQAILNGLLEGGDFLLEERQV